MTPTPARRLAAATLQLDDPAVAGAVAANPDRALRRYDEPLLIDEWQEIPQILGAIKRAVDVDPRPGRFLLTGSVEAQLTAKMWPATGRVVQLVFHGLTEREIVGRAKGPGLLTRISTGELDQILLLSSQLVIDDYIDLAMRGSFPEPALQLSGVSRSAWFDAYLDHVVTRDVFSAGQIRDPERLRQYLEVLALSTAGLPSNSTLCQSALINQRTAGVYDSLLCNLYLLDLVPVWSSNRLTRLAKRPKRYLVDAALAASAARVDARTILSDGDLLGRMLDTFVVSQLRTEVDLMQPRARLYHLRDEYGRVELDTLVDLGSGRIIGIETKATSAPRASDARHLFALRKRLGDSFIGGIVFHTGPQAFELGERVVALPISVLWMS